jgi:hypothetical protein
MNSKLRLVATEAQTIPVWRLVGWGSVIAVNLASGTSMYLTEGLHWSASNFISTSVILGIVGGLVELVVRVTNNLYYRLGSCLAIFAGFAVLWFNLSDGMIGDKANPTNLFFSIVIMLAVAGAWGSFVHCNVLPLFLCAAGTAQVAIGLFGGILGNDRQGGTLTIALAIIWWIAGGLFFAAGRGFRVSNCKRQKADPPNRYPETHGKPDVIR